LWLHSLKVAQLLRSAACLHTNQSRSYLNHLVLTRMVSSKYSLRKNGDRACFFYLLLLEHSVSMMWYWEMKALLLRRQPCIYSRGKETRFILGLLGYFLVRNVRRARSFPCCCTLCAKRTGSQVSDMERNCTFQKKDWCVFLVWRYWELCCSETWRRTRE